MKVGSTRLKPNRNLYKARNHRGYMQHYAGQYYHVYNRGTNRQPIFSTEENYEFLLRRVKQFLPLYSVRILAYVLMPNHYHFLIGVDKDKALSSFIQRLFNSYSQAFNQQQHRTGTFFSSPQEYKDFVPGDIPDALERKLAKYYFD